MEAKPQKEHEWLHKLVGEWSFEGECGMGPDQPPMKSTGTETVRSAGCGRSARAKARCRAAAP
jgi:hypothetical protein